MKTFDEKHIKNIVLLGSTKSGKTTLTETMRFEAGLTRRRGDISQDNTVSDYHDIEHEKHYSVYTTPLHTEWRGYKINILDTPGMDDLIGEVAQAVRVADTCVLAINAQSGVEVGDEVIWNYIEQFSKPSIMVINQLDHEKADFDLCTESIHEHFGNKPTLLQYPFQTGPSFHQIIDVLKMVMYEFPNEGGKPQKKPIPDSEMEKATKLHFQLVERAAENDEELMEKYFENGSLTEEDLTLGIRLGMRNHDIFPIFCVSALKNMGTGRLMGFIDEIVPSACDLKPETLESGKEFSFKDEKQPSLFVYKTIVEPFLGKISYFKVMSGTVKKDIELYNQNQQSTEKLHHLFICDGNERIGVEELAAGDLGATIKLKKTSTNDTLSPRESNIQFKPTQFPQARLIVHAFAESKIDNEKLGEVLKEMQEEDPSMRSKYSKELRQLLVYCQGDLHLEIIKWKLENIHQLKPQFAAPKTPYRETIQKNADANYRHKKQSGGAGQFGEVSIRISPYTPDMNMPGEFSIRGEEIVDLEWGGKLAFYNCIVGGVIDLRYLPSIKKGVLDQMEEGLITKSQMADIAVFVYDGKMHSVDSNDISFRLAGKNAFKMAFEEAAPKILEPIHEVVCKVPEIYMGDTMTDLQNRRASIQSMDPEGKYQVINALVPLAEMDGFSTSLKAITHGRGTFTWSFQNYQTVPEYIQKELIQQYKKEEFV